METEVIVDKDDCSLKIGSPLGESSCPYRNSLACPLTKEKVEDTNSKCKTQAR